MNGKIRTIIIDIFTINLAWIVYFLLRIRTGWISYTAEPDFLIPMLAICIYWLVLFFLFGLYRPWYAKSRLDEFATIFRAVTFGVLFLFFMIFIDDAGMGSPLHSRFLIVLYWSFMILFVGSGRFLMHTIQRRMLIAGIGLRNALIVGWSPKAKELFHLVDSHPALGYKVVGFVSPKKNYGRESYKDLTILGTFDELPKLISEHNVKDILISLDSSEHDQLLRVISWCDSNAVSIKIVPDLYDIISGQARTNQIYGFPLIEIMPELMQPWERAVKRTIDIIFSLTILIAGLPLWIIVAIAIKLDSKGRVFYTQERVGREEKHFRIIKFRSMHEGAEHASGPVWANKKDPRVTRVGKILRRLRLDEVPQLINVLYGDMSLVGPRPERPYFVEQLSKEIPLYRRRLKVRPGITGWAQVKHKYDENIEDVRKKVQYDLF